MRTDPMENQPVAERERLPRAVALRRRATLSAILMSSGLLSALLWSFWPAIETMSKVWSHNPQYSHGFLVPLFALFVLWSRRDLASHKMGPSWWGVLILSLGAALRLGMAYFYFQWLDQAALLVCLAGIVVVLGGREGWRWAWPAVLFLSFMLPLPYQLEIALAHPLQRLATLCSTYALETLGLPVLAEGNIIILGDMRIGVYEACSGLGMLVTFVAMSAAVAFVSRGPLLEKMIIGLSAIPIAVIMNIARITVTGVLYHTVNSHVANLVFHDLAGWFMMPLALCLLWLELKVLGRLVIRDETTTGVPFFPYMERILRPKAKGVV